MTGCFSESATRDCCSSGADGNSFERAHGQFASQLGAFDAGDAPFNGVLGVQQLFVVSESDLLQQDLAESFVSFLHWQALPVPQLPQQAFAVDVPERQP